MLIIDPWLMDLGVQGPEQAHIAAYVGRAQFRVHRRLGHVMNLGGELERFRIEQQARYGKIAREAVYCLRCGAGATLDTWVRDDVLSESGEPALNIGSLNDIQLTAVAFRLPCQGTRVAKVAGDMLKGWLDARGVLP